ncbi:MAG: hypothetical protein ACK5K7_05435 [Bacilli bacterium]
MKNFGRGILGRLIMIAVGFLMFVGIYFFSAGGKAESLYEDFKSNMESSGQIHTIEASDGSKLVAYITEDDQYGYVMEYGEESLVLNCDEDNQVYKYLGEDYSDQINFDDECSAMKSELDTSYNETLKQFFNGDYEADYEKKDDYYFVKGMYTDGGIYTISLYKDGNKVIWEDSEINYTVEIKDDVIIPIE